MSLAENLTDDDLDAIADALQDHGDFYTRRQIIAAAAATGSLGGMLGLLGVDDASAQSSQVGTIGSDSSRVDLFAEDVDVSNQVTAPTVNAEDVNNTLVASTGEIQTKIDEVAASTVGRGRVELKPKTEFDPTSTIRVKSGVELDCQNATIAPSSDIDLFELEPNSKLANCTVDLSGFAFTSSVFNVDPAFGGTYWADELLDNCTIIADQGTGTGLSISSTGTEADDVALCEFQFNIKRPPNATGTSIGTAVDILLESSSTFINGNKVKGMFAFPNEGIVQRGTEDLIDNNIYNVILQPSSNSSGAGWRLERGNKNIIDGKLWDGQEWGNGSEGWVIGTNAGSFNSLRTEGATFSTFITDNAGDPSNTYIAPSTFGASARSRSVRAGYEATAENTKSAAFGNAATATDDSTTAIGADASAGNNRNAAFGHNASATSSGNALSVGTDSSASGAGGVAVGVDADANATTSVALGFDTAVATSGVGRVGVDQLVFGGIQNTIADADLNNQELTVEADEANSQFIIRYKDSSGTIQTGTLNFD